MTHLSAAELVEAVEGTLGSDRHAHVATCAHCRREVAQLQATLAAVRESSIPEPSPLFWTHFSTRVHDVIAADPVDATRWSTACLGWRVVTPVAVLAMLVLTLATTLPREPMAGTTGSEGAVASDRRGDEEWAVLTELVASLDVDAAHDLGIISLGDAERAALQLTAAEQRELVRLFEEEMKKGGS